MGLPAEILSKAEQIAGVEHIDFDRQLQDLELKKLELDNKEKQLKSGDAFLSEMIEKYEKLYGELDIQKRHIISEAKREAKKIVEDSNRMIEKTIKEIRETSAEKDKTKQLRSELDEWAKQQEAGIVVSEGPNSEKKKKQKTAGNQQVAPVVEKGPIMVGDNVRISGQETIGEVIALGEKMQPLFLEAYK
jgi:DNA mismatch repair protein MutS2